MFIPEVHFSQDRRAVTDVTGSQKDRHAAGETSITRRYTPLRLGTNGHCFELYETESFARLGARQSCVPRLRRIRICTDAKIGSASEDFTQ